MTEELTAADLIAARPALSRHALDGLLLDGVPLAAIAAQFGTPAYVMGADTLAARGCQMLAAMPGVAVHYAVKANDHLAVLSVLAGLGFGADVVSGGEFLRAIAGGFPPGKIVFSGVGKTADELALALRLGCGQINVESAEELALLSTLAVTAGVVAPVVLRVNPDVDAGTHDKISTGRAGDKFGVPYDTVADLYARGSAMPGLSMRGLAVHIGSQIFAALPFTSAYRRLAGLVRDIRAAGHTVEIVDCGGGLGVPYGAEAEMLPAAWYGAMQAALGDLGVQLAVEPGRWCVAPCAVLLTRVIRTRREAMVRPIMVLDAAMNDFLRPAMYGAYHGIVAVAAVDLVAPVQTCDIVGPVCESADIFARARAMPDVADGGLVAILDVGAYGAVMASGYNARPMAAQIMVRGGVAHLVRGRPEITSLWQNDVILPA